MPDRDLEIEVLSLFVCRAKRERCLDFVAKEKTRDRVFEELRSPAIFDSGCVVEIGGTDRATAATVIEKYSQLGMGGRVYVMSENSEWDGTKFQMSYIVETSLARGYDTLGFCWKTKTAFYEWHHSGASYFLRAIKDGLGKMQAPRSSRGSCRPRASSGDRRPTSSALTALLRFTARPSTD